MVTVIGQIERISASSDRRYAFSGHSQRLSYTALHNYVFSAAHDSRYLSTRVIWDTDTQYTIYLWHASGTMDWLDAAQSYRTEWPVIVKSPEKAHMIEPISHRDSEKGKSNLSKARLQ
ncbi:hypothetical protein PMIN06_001620 [Paraphaeosphaeria minitans]